MSIVPFQSNLTAIGHFDFLDADLPNVKGGQVIVFDSLGVNTSDQRSQDVFNQNQRTLMRLANNQDAGPFFLAQVEDQKSRLTPGFETTSLFSTMNTYGVGVEISGKIGLYDQEGFYAVSSDVTASISASTAVGTRLYVEQGQLTTSPSASGAIVGFFAEFRSGAQLRAQPLNLHGTYLTSNTIIFYKANADGYLNLSFMQQLIGTFGTLGTPTDPFDGYYALTNNTTIADAANDFNQGLDTLFNNQIPDLTNVVTTSTNYTLNTTDGVVLANAASPITITLPDAIRGRRITIKKIDTSGFGVTINSADASLIENEVDALINTFGTALTLVYDGAAWWII